MAAQTDRILHRFALSCSRERVRTALYGCAALITVAIGVLGLESDSWLRRRLESQINVHVLFALLLCGLVLARCQWCVARSPRFQTADILELSRELSRMVYLFLYVVIGTRGFIGILHGLWQGGALDLGLFDPRFRQDSDHAGFNPKDDAQLLLASGLVSLLFVRVLAFTLWSRDAQRVAACKAAKRTILRAPGKLKGVGR